MEKLNIKTITCHDVYNTGASLQAYALSYYLKQLGHNVEIIDYKPKYLKHYKLWGVNNPKYDKPFLRVGYNILKFPIRLKERFSKRKKVFDNFTNTYLPITKQTYNSNESLKMSEVSADIFFAGSDQIWNTLFPNGKDPAFYLDFAPKNSVCASYAASFATEDIEDEDKIQVTEWVKKLNFISVREKTGVNILDKLGVTNVYQVVDPVFLLPKSEWQNLLSKEENTEKYILIYDFDNNEQLNKKAITLAKNNGYKIYSIFPNTICDKCFWNAGPLEFIELIRDSELVLSNSFHATAFAIIFEKQFIVFDRNENINTRMRDLIDDLGISMEDAEIDYGKVNTVLANQIEQSKNYINLVISSVRKD